MSQDGEAVSSQSSNLGYEKESALTLCAASDSGKSVKSTEYEKQWIYSGRPAKPEKGTLGGNFMYTQFIDEI